MTADAARTAWLDQLEALHTAAIPSAPWEHVIDDHGRKGVEHSIWEPGNEFGDLGDYVAEQVDSGEDAELIVAAVNSLPALLALARGVAELAETYAFLGATLHTVPAAESYTDAANDLRKLLADAAPHTGQETP